MKQTPSILGVRGHTASRDRRVHLSFSTAAMQVGAPVLRNGVPIADVERLLDRFTMPCTAGGGEPTQPGSGRGGHGGASCGCQGQTPPHHFTVGQFASQVCGLSAAIAARASTALLARVHALALSVVGMWLLPWRPSRRAPSPHMRCCACSSHQVLYKIHPNDYARLCPRADSKPGVGGSNKDLAVIVKDWMGLDEAPGPDKKVGGRVVQYPVVGRVLVDKLDALVATERAAVQRDAIKTAIEAVPQTEMLPEELCERIRCRKCTNEYGGVFDKDALAQAIEEASAAEDLPEPLQQRIGLCDGQAASLLEGLSISDTPTLDAKRLGLPTQHELALAVFDMMPMPGYMPSRLRRAARDFARRRAMLALTDDGGEDGGGGEGGGGSGDGEGSLDVHGRGGGGGGTCDDGSSGGGGSGGGRDGGGSEGGEGGVGGWSDSGDVAGGESGCESSRQCGASASHAGKRARSMGVDLGGGGKSGTRDARAAARKRRAGVRGEASGAASVDDGKGATCCICLETVDSKGALLGCNHSFHLQCIVEMVRKGTREQHGARSRCPLCRAPIASMCALDENGERGRDIPVPEVAEAVADAERNGSTPVRFGPRVHSGVNRALRTLQSELRGVAPEGRRRNR